MEIAREVSISEATVHKRIERLLTEGVIKVVAVPDPTKVGFPTTLTSWRRRTSS